MSSARTLIAKLQREMASRALNQVDVAKAIKVSPATVCRALSSGAASAGLQGRIAEWLKRLDQSSPADEELHLLRKSFMILQSLDEKVEALAMQIRGAGRVATDD